MASLSECLAEIRRIQQTVTGVERAYDPNNPPDSIEELPAFVSYPAISGWAEIDYTVSREDHRYPVSMRLLLRSSDLGQAVGLAIGFVESVRATFRQHVTLGGRCTWARITRWRLGELQYAGESYAGIEFELMVHTKDAVTATTG